MERFGLTSLDDLPPLDAEVAARLVVPDAGTRTTGDADDGRPEAAATMPDLDGSMTGEPVRIQKALADAGVASRRAAEALVAAGRVTVNGEPATRRPAGGPWASTGIAVDGRPVGARPRAVYLALHKPAGVTSTVADRHAERTVIDLVPRRAARRAGRLYPVGRLDRDSEGLLLLTNDGDWAQRVLHPRYDVEREYAVGRRGRRSWRPGRCAPDGGCRARGGRGAGASPIRRQTRPETRRLVALGRPAAPPTRLDLVSGGAHAGLAAPGAADVRRPSGAPVERLVRVRIGTLRLDDLRAGRGAAS